jgi:SAM-dependent methyltransferase
MDYYKNNAKAFVESTLQVDMQPLYQRFLPLLPKRALILDAGCGSGRDAKSFIELGHQVTAFDSSVEIAALAEKEIGQPVQVQPVQDIRYQQQFDGIWACASLLHVPYSQLSDVFQRLNQALRPGGVLYASFKYGSGEHERDGRYFTDMNEGDLAMLLGKMDSFSEVQTWVTEDRRPGREGEQWLNTLLRAEGNSWRNA